MGPSKSSERSSTAFSRSLSGRWAKGMGVSKRKGVPLVILEEVLLVSFCKVVGHGVCPFQGHAAALDLFNCLLHELNLWRNFRLNPVYFWGRVWWWCTYLDPSQRRSNLHIFHLLFSFDIQVKREFGGLFMISPAVIILNGTDQHRDKKQKKNEGSRVGNAPGKHDSGFGHHARPPRPFRHTGCKNTRQYRVHSKGPYTPNKIRVCISCM